MRVLTLVLGFVFSLAACAQEKYQEGVHYKRLPQPVKTITPGKIEVTEAFAYTCGHCFNFEPLILAWEKKAPSDVQLVKLPVVWRATMKPLARILYTGEVLKKGKEVNAKVFDALHRQRKQLNSESAVAELFKELGVSEEEFKKTYNSFGVNSRVQQAEARTRSMNVTGTPQMIVDGRYTVSASRDIGHEGMLEIVDFLIEKIRTEKAVGKH